MREACERRHTPTGASSTGRAALVALGLLLVPMTTACGSVGGPSPTPIIVTAVPPTPVVIVVTATPGPQSAATAAPTPAPIPTAAAAKPATASPPAAAGKPTSGGATP